MNAISLESNIVVGTIVQGDFDVDQWVTSHNTILHLLFDTLSQPQGYILSGTTPPTISLTNSKSSSPTFFQRLNFSQT